MDKNYYELLGISVDATKKEIREAYLKLAKKYHPDTSKEENAEEMMTKINEAYNVLSDEKKRAKYDLDLSRSSADDSDVYTEEECEEDVSNYTQKERRETEKVVIKQIILEELEKVKVILESKNDIIIGAYAGEYDDESYYYTVLDWVEIVQEYIQSLKELMIKAKDYELFEHFNQLSSTITDLQKEIKDMPVKLSDAVFYTERQIFIDEMSKKIGPLKAEFKSLITKWINLYVGCYESKIDEKKYMNQADRLIHETNLLVDVCNKLIFEANRLQVDDEYNVKSILADLLHLSTKKSSYNKACEIGSNLYVNKKLDKIFADNNLALDKAFKVKSMIVKNQYDKNVVRIVEDMAKSLEENMNTIYDFGLTDRRFNKMMYDFATNFIWSEGALGITHLSWCYLNVRKLGEKNVFKSHRKKDNISFFNGTLNSSICNEDVEELYNLYIVLYEYRKSIINSLRYNVFNNIKIIENYEEKRRNLYFWSAALSFLLLTIGFFVIFFGVGFLFQDVKTFVLHTIGGIGIIAFGAIPNVAYKSYFEKDIEKVEQIKEFIAAYNNSDLKDKRVVLRYKKNRTKNNWRV